MRVIQLLRKYDPAEWGGTETAVQRLCHGLREQDVTSLMYCPYVNGNSSQTVGADKNPFPPPGTRNENNGGVK